MLNTHIDETRYDAVWRASETYMRARKNDVHVPLSYGFAEKLLQHHPDADRDIVLLAILLHDIGWWSIDAEEIFTKGFGPNMMESDVRFLHEAEGVRLSREILEALGWPEATIAAVGTIIDGHDTRREPRSLNDRIVRDSDKLWRFTVTGVSVACDWFKMTPHQYADRLERDVALLMETDAGRAMAEAELSATRRILKLHLL
ncbi:HD domain-containing protein [Kaistia dalseonensis]|uniref:HD superfamily phosphodiesterase n=1 Tax=Kaistia dalseonensis TaxID=410840 RepID=A0ABU0H8P1_9HYPH|nr:HD domain-containing protein [Kaistia dalseonensis]MCX5496072.1 HD domain-containing protein [Kaistia dalseonensis]MDQ0438676.1 HD superfamily phosphodiesterase [Kaistia dalseonensis]